MSDSDRAAVRDLLYDGESAVESVRVGDARLVLTTRRLLVIREGTSPRVRAVDRTNLGDVRVRTRSDRGSLLVAAQWAGLGVFLLAAWWTVPLEGFVRPVEGAPDVGFEGLFAAVNALVAALAFLDEAFLAAGALALGWAVVRLAGYLRGRERVVEVDVAGADPVTLSSTDGETVGRLRALVSDRASRGSE